MLELTFSCTLNSLLYTSYLSPENSFLKLTDLAPSNATKRPQAYLTARISFETTFPLEPTEKLLVLSNLQFVGAILPTYVWIQAFWIPPEILVLMLQKTKVYSLELSSTVRLLKREDTLKIGQHPAAISPCIIMARHRTEPISGMRLI